MLLLSPKKYVAWPPSAVKLKVIEAFAAKTMVLFAVEKNPLPVLVVMVYEDDGAVTVAFPN